MRTCALIIAVVVCLVLSHCAHAGEDADFGNRLKCSQYAGAAVLVPKDKDFDPGPAFIYGAQWTRGGETIFLDLAFSETGASDSILWFSGDVRHTIARLGYKIPATKTGRLLLGANIQTQHMDFGARKFTSVSYGVTAEYIFAHGWSAQIESAQKTKKSGIYFGNFALYILKSI